tara:strand:+ start:205 stop:591 length:387 start_codon:yes stop_codon:yes gene_type:complete
MNISLSDSFNEVSDDQRFIDGKILFNSEKWYLAHDVFEELWHETNGFERQTIQGILQIAVAQLHLERNNKNGAIILYGEGLGRLKKKSSPNLGLNIKKLCEIVEIRLIKLQKGLDIMNCEIPYLYNLS